MSPDSFYDGTRALHVATEAGHKKVVDLLLKRGANADAQDSQGRLPVHAAVDAGRLGVLKLMVKKDKVFTYVNLWCGIHVFTSSPLSGSLSSRSSMCVCVCVCVCVSVLLH